MDYVISSITYDGTPPHIHSDTLEWQWWWAAFYYLLGAKHAEQEATTTETEYWRVDGDHFAYQYMRMRQQTDNYHTVADFLDHYMATWERVPA